MKLFSKIKRYDNRLEGPQRVWYTRTVWKVLGFTVWSREVRK